MDSNQTMSTKKIPRAGRGFFGGDTGIRTLDPMIKSHLLYQLSYVSKTELSHRRSGAILPHKKKKIKKKIRFIKKMDSDTLSFLNWKTKS